MMSRIPAALLTVTVLVTLGCASHQRPATPAANRSVITREAIALMKVSTAYDVLVRQLNRSLTGPLRGAATSFERPQEPLVIIDNSRTEVAALRVLPAVDVDEIRILDAREGTLQYGTGATNGVIVVATGYKPAETVRVEVDNHEFTNLRIHVVREGIDVLLGPVDGLSRRMFVVPVALNVTTAPIALTAVSLSGEISLRSPSVTVERGQVISWRVDRASRGGAISVR